MNTNTQRLQMTPEAWAAATCAYRRARKLYDAPIPSDHILRTLHTRDFNAACEDLRLALGRERYEASVFDTMDDEMPIEVVRCGPAAVLSWNEAAAIRRELERLAI